jgi:RimJ/RimL family protein N-acetyltransferase
VTERADPFATGLPTVEGADLRLRALEPRDREQVFALYADKEAVRFGFQPKMDTADDATALIERTRTLAAERSVFHWGVARTEDDRVVGHATLFHLDVEQGRAEIGYSIVRDLWGRGLGRRAVGLLVGFAFDTLELRRVEADVDPRNEASLRLVERLGFVREGYLRERWLLGGEIQDAVLFGLLRREWMARTLVRS